jgi:hypothetical protein
MRKLVFPILLLTGSFCFSDTLTMRDGTQHYGTVQSTTAQYVTLKEGRKVRQYSRPDIQSIQFDNSNNSSYAPPSLSPSEARNNVGRSGISSAATVPQTKGSSILRKWHRI